MKPLKGGGAADATDAYGFASLADCWLFPFLPTV
jgi:hypothetical protein